jgi:membrane peptidoglycan carboxypeptidase
VATRTHPIGPLRVRAAHPPGHARRIVRLSRARRHLDAVRDGHRQAGGTHRLLALVGGLTIAALLVPVLAVGLIGTAAVVTVQHLSEALPDPATLNDLGFAEPTTVYDRSGKVQLGEFQVEDRRIVAFDEIPHIVLDATTTAEDRTFWTNGGFDLPAILEAAAQNLSGSDERGASTITQQLVRARLLPADVVAPGADRYRRKAMELIQAWRLTTEFPGEAGKEKVITAYLNENFYGHGAYGIAAAAAIYFGVTDLKKLTPAQATLLAALPQSPTTYDPYLFAKRDAKKRLVVDPRSAIVARRNYLLDFLNTARWTHLTPTQLSAARREPVILAGDKPQIYRAPQFTWAVRAELDDLLGGDAKVAAGGYRVITSLDWNAQQLAEKWVTAAVIAPNIADRAAYASTLDRLGIDKADRAWLDNLRGKDLHNGALVAIDYRTGDVLAYVGSAGYYRDDLASDRFDPKFDVVSAGYRQPGSAWKPILYSTAFAERKLTPGSLLLDITTRFAPTWVPTDADQLDRGPVLVRRALQYSLNVPAIRALERVGNDDVATRAAKFGIAFQGGRIAFLQAGLAGALGTVEVRPLDLTSAYGTIANGGVRYPPRLVLKVIGPDGSVVYDAGRPKAERLISPGAAFLTANILEGNTDPDQNPIWSRVLELTNGPHGERRPAAVKTGTTNDTRDLATYGFLPRPDGKGPGLAVGIWMCNSDHSYPRAKDPPISLTAPAPLWHAFVRDLTAGDPVTDFEPPDGVVRATIDAWSGGAPGPWTRETTSEWFLAGTQPGAPGAVDPPALLYDSSCGFWTVDPLKAELGPPTWNGAVADWMARARIGPGVEGDLGSRTAYFWGRFGWGGRVGTCTGVAGLGVSRPVSRPEPTASPGPTASGAPPDASPPQGGGGDGKPHKPPKPRKP